MLEAFDRWDYSGLGSLPQRQAIKALRELFPALKQAAAVEATLHRAMHCCASGDVDGEGVRTNHTPTASLPLRLLTDQASLCPGLLRVWNRPFHWTQQQSKVLACHLPFGEFRQRAH